MVKLTKRKGFNFFRSYYDVFNELPENEKLAFIEALLDKQFLGIDPTDLTGMARFAWISQVNSIESQVKGYEDKTGVNLNPRQGGVERPRQGEFTTPTEQVEEKVEVEVEEKEQNNSKNGSKEPLIDFDALLKFFNDFTGKKVRLFPEKAKRQFKARLKQGYTKKDILLAIKNCYKDEYHKKNNHKHLTLEFISREDKLAKYSQAPEQTIDNFGNGKVTNKTNQVGNGI